VADRDPGGAAMRARDLFAALRPSQGGSAELVDKRGHHLRLIHLGEVAQQAGRLLDRPPLTVFWESDTGCLRVTHRELVLRFASSVPERWRRFTTDVSQPGRGFAPGGLHTDQFGGTSAATAISAGVAALVLSVNPDLDRGELKDLLEQTAEKIGGGYDTRGHSHELGFGRVDAGRAVEEAARRAVSSKRGYSGKACSTRPLSCFRLPRSS
jgi:hypothetical protein